MTTYRRSVDVTAPPVPGGRDFPWRRELGSVERDYVRPQPEDARRIARSLEHLAYAFRDDAAELRRLLVEAEALLWGGDFQEHVFRRAPRVASGLERSIAERLDKVAGGLVRFAHHIDELRHEARVQLQRGQAAEDRRVANLDRKEDVEKQPDADKSVVPLLDGVLSNEHRNVDRAVARLGIVRDRLQGLGHGFAEQVEVETEAIRQTTASSEVDAVAGATGPGVPSAATATVPVTIAGAPGPTAVRGVEVDVQPVEVAAGGGSFDASAGHSIGPVEVGDRSPQPGYFVPTGLPEQVMESSGGPGVSAAGVVSAGAALGAAALAGGRLARLRSTPSGDDEAAPPGRGGPDSDRPSVTHRRGFGRPSRDVGGRSADHQVSSPAESVSPSAIVPILGAASCAAVGLLLARKVTVARKAEPGGTDRWLDLGRDAIGPRVWSRLEGDQAGSPTSPSDVAGERTLPPLTREQILPGGVTADVPTSWAVARGDDCVVLRPRHGHRFAPNIVIFADRSGGADELAGLDALDGVVLLDHGSTDGVLKGGATRFGYVVGDAGLTVHRVVADAPLGGRVVATATVATTRVDVDLGALDAVLASLRAA